MLARSGCTAGVGENRRDYDGAMSRPRLLGGCTVASRHSGWDGFWVFGAVGGCLEWMNED